jgi:poly(3-hydroxybutyrate) depolymerase
MLYHMHEWQRATWLPARLMAEATLQLHRNPFFPLSYSRYGRSVAATCELFERTTRRHGKPVFGLDETRIDGKAVAVTEEIVHRRDFCDLIHFRRESSRQDPKVLLVAPMSGHFATLLRGTVQALLPDHEVYITDWLNASEVPTRLGGFDLDDYVDYIIEFLKFLGSDTHVIAVCQPSVPVLAAVAMMSAGGDPAVPRTMTLMGGPIDTRRNPTKVNEFAENHSIEWFERNMISTVPAAYPGFMRRVLPGFVQLGGFMGMNLDRHIGAHISMFEHLVEGDGESAAAHRRFYDEYMAVMDMTAEYFLQTVRRVFRDHDLPRGEFHWRGHRVDPAAITKTALLTVEGEFDDISGPGQTVATHDLCTNIPADRQAHHLQKGVGHYGIFNGRRWRNDILPVISDFIRAR